jgi:hypothetical protein
MTIYLDAKWKGASFKKDADMSTSGAEVVRFRHFFRVKLLQFETLKYNVALFYCYVAICFNYMYVVFYLQLPSKFMRVKK